MKKRTFLSALLSMSMLFSSVASPVLASQDDFVDFAVESEMVGPESIVDASEEVTPMVSLASADSLVDEACVGDDFASDDFLLAEDIQMQEDQEVQEVPEKQEQPEDVQMSEEETLAEEDPQVVEEAELVDPELPSYEDISRWDGFMNGTEVNGENFPGKRL